MGFNKVLNLKKKLLKNYNKKIIYYLKMEYKNKPKK